MLANGSHDNANLQKAWDEYGPDAFDFRITFGLPLAGLEELVEFERQEIARAGSFNIVKNPTIPMGHSNKGRKASEATKLKMSIAAKKRGVPDKVRRASSIANKGNKHAEGLERSPETRARMSAAMTGLKRTEQGRRNMSIAQKKRYREAKALTD